MLLVCAVAPATRADGPSTAPSPPASPWASPPSPGPASTAPAAEINEIVLQDGRTLSGHVASLHPGEHLVLETTDGQQTLIRWREIARADGPSFPGGFRAYMTLSPPGRPAVPRAVEILVPGEGRVPLRLEAPERVTVGLPDVEWFRGFQRVAVEGRGVCHTPCTLYVPPVSVRLTADTPSSATDYVVVNIDPAGTRAIFAVPPHGLGTARLVLEWGGLVIFAAGAASTIAGFYNSSSTLEYAGFTGLGVGLLSFVTSMIMGRFNHVTLGAATPLEPR